LDSSNRLHDTLSGRIDLTQFYGYFPSGLWAPAFSTPTFTSPAILTVSHFPLPEAGKALRLVGDQESVGGCQRAIKRLFVLLLLQAFLH